MIDPFRIKAHIPNFRDIPILVIGDLILDEYVWGEVYRISPEAPVPVVLVKEESIRLGGAANVANNLKSLGGRPILCGVVGEDLNGDRFLELLKDCGIETDHIIRSPERPTTVKTRIIARSQQVVRLDKETARPVPLDTQRLLLAQVMDAVEEVKGVIISDYKKGVVAKGFMEGLFGGLGERRDGIYISLDPKPGNYEAYYGVDIITPNQQEAESFCGFSLDTHEELLRAYETFKKRLGIRQLLITQGAQGMTLFEDDSLYHIPTSARKVFDVTGAGDTVISTLTLAKVSGLTLLESAVLANVAAGIVVGEVGTSVVSVKELEDGLESLKIQI